MLPEKREGRMREAWVQGKAVPRSVLGELVDSSGLIGDAAGLRGRLAEDGYLFLRGVIDPVPVQAARAEVLGRLEAVGEIVPGSGGVFSGTSRRREMEPDLGGFWQSVSEGKAFRAVSHGAAVRAVMADVAGGEVVGQDYVFLRVGVPGRATGAGYGELNGAKPLDQPWHVR
jgi:hypothetical protein